MSIGWGRINPPTYTPHGLVRGVKVASFPTTDVGGLLWYQSFIGYANNNNKRQPTPLYPIRALHRSTDSGADRPRGWVCVKSRAPVW